MTRIEEASEALRAARVTARAQAREEYREQIDNRIDELTGVERRALIEAIRGAYESGAGLTEIKTAARLHYCDWSALKEEAGIPDRRPAGEMPHGRSGSYVRGCRCEECRQAMREYQREYYARRRKVNR